MPPDYRHRGIIKKKSFSALPITYKILSLKYDVNAYAHIRLTTIACTLVQASKKPRQTDFYSEYESNVKLSANSAEANTDCLITNPILVLAGVYKNNNTRY